MPDEALLAAARGGDTVAFGELWERHRLAGLTAARNLAPSLDPEDLVSEAYLKIFELVRDGRGPTGAFRPYLYQVIRSASANRFRSGEQAEVSLIETPALHATAPWEDNAFDLNAVTAAFATLTPRWQSVLWYTEVEGLPPREAATLLGLSPNSTSVLASRARDALKSAWVEAHVNQQLADEACRSTIEHLQRYQRKKLTARLTREVEAHLDECDACTRAAAEASSLNRQLGLVLAWISLGAAGTAALSSQLKIAGFVGGASAATAGLGAQSGGAAAGGSAAAGSAPAALVSAVSGLVSSVGMPAVIGGASLLVAAAVGVGAVALTLPAGTPPVPVDAPEAAAQAGEPSAGDAQAGPADPAPRAEDSPAPATTETAPPGYVAIESDTPRSEQFPPALDSAPYHGVALRQEESPVEAPRRDNGEHDERPAVEPPPVVPPVVLPPTVEPPTVEPPIIEPPVVEPPVIEPPVIEPPTVVEPPVIEPPVIEPPTVIEPPVIGPPVIEPPTVRPPIVWPPWVKPPIVDPPIITLPGDPGQLAEGLRSEPSR